MNHVPAASRKEVWAWCMYDFANSSFTTLIVTVAYSVYFTEIVAKGYSGEALWGRANSISMIIVGILSPILGALSDSIGKKKSFLIFFTQLCVISTGLLFFVKEGDIISGIVLFIIGNIGYNGGITFYNAFLKDISREDEMGRISGMGWALGYVGGLICLAMSYPLIAGGFEQDTLIKYRLSFVLTALFFLLASVPTFIILKDRGDPGGNISNFNYLTIGFKRVRQTLREIKKYKELFKYFVSYLIYTDGINTIIVFTAIFASRVLFFTPKEIMIYFILTQITAATGAYIFGHITDRLGAKKTISITLVIWIGLIAWAYFIVDKFQFLILGLIAGIALGSNQAASRTLLGQFAPRGKSAEFFGLFALTGKIAATVGPLIYGEITSLTGNQRNGILSIGPFFIVGLFLLYFVDEEKGRIKAASG